MVEYIKSVYTDGDGRWQQRLARLARRRGEILRLSSFLLLLFPSLPADGFLIVLHLTDLNFSCSLTVSSQGCLPTTSANMNTVSHRDRPLRPHRTSAFIPPRTFHTTTTSPRALQAKSALTLR